jgi:hypothetical protein
MPVLMSTPYQIYHEFINDTEKQTEIFQTALQTLNTPEGKRNLDILIGQRLEYFNGEGLEKLKPLVNTILNMGMQKLRPVVDKADAELLRQQSTVSLRQHPGTRFEEVSSDSESDAGSGVAESTVSGIGGQALLPRRGGGRKTKRRRRKTKCRVRKSKKVKKRKSKKSR